MSLLHNSESFEGPRESLLGGFPVTGLPKSRTNNSKKKFRLTMLIPWIIFIALIGAILIQWKRPGPIICDGRHFWKDHEIEGAKREIVPTVKEVTFTGGLKIKPDVGLYREIDPHLPIYVGSPTPEIDAAWAAITDPMNLFLTLDEASIMGEDGMIKEPASGLYMAMPQVLHDLHCVNYLRKALSLEYYPEMNDSILQVHIEHCLDGIRQSLMCYSDMTIIKEYWTDLKGQNGGMMADFDNVHICRDFDTIRNWMTSRNAEDDEIWPSVAARLKAGASYKTY